MVVTRSRSLFQPASQGGGEGRGVGVGVGDVWVGVAPGLHLISHTEAAVGGDGAGWASPYFPYFHVYNSSSFIFNILLLKNTGRTHTALK